MRMSTDQAVRTTRSRKGQSSCAHEAGFTLMELVIAVAVALMLAAFAAPSFENISQNTQSAGEYNALTRALHYARSEAIKTSDSVSVCARATDSSCGTDWANGWIVFTDSLSNGGSESVVDATDAVLRVKRSDDDIRIAAHAVIRPLAMAPVSSIRFSSRGRADWSVGTLVLCDDRGLDSARALIVNGAGTLRKSEAVNGSPVLDAVGNPVACP